ncbi:hypothetical protein [Streptomyces pristinaespiralis]|uniref:hypothetical protein n=1 Tax=Streptomyces pristinaespiralis TaxID=38300 RepID=UPI0033CFFF40
MDWTVLLTTGFGAVIGVGSTLLADQVRWRRDTEDRDREALRSAYAQYLEALTAARDAISQASLIDSGDEPEVARTAFLDHGVYIQQYQLELIAPEQVVGKAKAAAHALAEYRDVVVSGSRRADVECTAARRAFRQSREQLMDAMRQALAR